mmetsp:Transcript_108190/g.191541  ORF Transcript_108190/g.191541 Transcript_108190/m.191541 type:complete len:240 (-) Transcript_108190:617-1336(-)
MVWMLRSPINFSLVCSATTPVHAKPQAAVLALLTEFPDDAAALIISQCSDSATGGGTPIWTTTVGCYVTRDRAGEWRAAVFTKMLQVRDPSPRHVLPCGDVGKRQEAVESQKTAHHQEEDAYDKQPHNEEDTGLIHCNALDALAEKNDELRSLQKQEPVEEHAVVFSNTITQPRTMVIMSANAPVAVLAVLHAKRLVEAATLTPTELLAALSGLAALLATLIGRASTLLNSTSLSQGGW